MVWGIHHVPKDRKERVWRGRAGQWSQHLGDRILWRLLKAIKKPPLRAWKQVRRERLRSHIVTNTQSNWGSLLYSLPLPLHPSPHHPSEHSGRLANSWRQPQRLGHFPCFQISENRSFSRTLGVGLGLLLQGSWLGWKVRVLEGPIIIW